MSKSRVIIITGASGHLGEMAAEEFKKLNYKLILVDKKLSQLKLLEKKISKDGFENVEIFKCDLESQISREDLIKKIKKKYSAIDVLLNNAAFVGTTKLSGWNEVFEKQSISTWKRAIEVNLTAPFHLSQGLYQLMSKGKSSSIINIISTYGFLGPNWDLYKGTKMGNPAAYAASKGGLLQLTRWLSTTLAPKIRVNSISPGGIFRNQNKKFVQRYIERTPMKRMASENDILGAITYLSSEESNYVTGQNIIVDGGWSAW